MRRIVLLLIVFLLVMPNIAQDDEMDTSWSAIVFSPTVAHTAIFTDEGLQSEFVIDAFRDPVDWDWSLNATISPDGRYLAFQNASFVPSEETAPRPILIATMADGECCISLPFPETTTTTLDILGFDETGDHIAVATEDDGGVPETLVYSLTTSPPELVDMPDFEPVIVDISKTRSRLGEEYVRTGNSIDYPFPEAMREYGMSISGFAGNVVAHRADDDDPLYMIHVREGIANAQAIWGMNGDAVLIVYDDYPERPNFVTIVFRDGETVDVELDVNDIFGLHGTPTGWIVLTNRFDQDLPNQIVHISLDEGEPVIDIITENAESDTFIILPPTLDYTGDPIFVPISDEEFVPFAG